MQRLIDTNEALKTEIKGLQEQVTNLKAAAKANKSASATQATNKGKSGFFGTLLQKTKSLSSRRSSPRTGDGADGTAIPGAGSKIKAIKLLKGDVPELTAEQKAIIDDVHHMILNRDFSGADELLNRPETKKAMRDAKSKKGAPDARIDWPNLRDEFGETVLFKAIRENEKELVFELLSKGEKADTVDYEGETPLMVAAKYGDMDVVQVLVDDLDSAGSGVNARTKYTKKSALHYAVEQDHLPVVELLLENGCDPLFEDAEGKTAFDRSNNVEVKKLLKAKMLALNPEIAGKLNGLEVSKPAGKDTKKALALEELEKEEKDYSNDPEMKPLFQEKAQLEMQKKRLKLQITELQAKSAPKDAFIKAKALNKDKRDEFLGVKKQDEKVKAFFAAVLGGDDPEALETVEEMLTEPNARKRVDKNATDGFGETALMKAARLGYIKMVSYLLVYKCDVNARDVEGYTALMKAAQFGKLDCCVKLISEGADLNATTSTGKLSALMLAAERGHNEVCKMLIEEGCNHQLVNSNNQKAIGLARTNDTRKIIEKAMDEHPHREEVPMI